jgi:hypothetical protein
MRGLLVMGIRYQHAPEVSIVRTDTCRSVSLRLSPLIFRASPRNRLTMSVVQPEHRIQTAAMAMA